MAEIIGFQNGIKAAMNALRGLDPAHKAAYDKLERTLTILAKDHDAGIAPPPPPPPDDPPPPPPTLFPQSYNKGSSGQDARYATFGKTSDGRFEYDSGGRCRGGRSGQFIPELKPADQMDGNEPWDPYEYGGRTIGPWYPPKSYEV